ncbi:MAG: SusD/RagB family nutrient-binding outer membrane lipoprotein, partial [Catalinimonas sp.]
DGLIADIDLALSIMDDAPDAASLDEQDIIFGGDLDLWRRFANTLKWRIYMRQSNARADVAQVGIAGLVGQPLIDGPGDEPLVAFLDERQDLYNPQAQQEFQRPDDYGISAQMVALLESYDDPRLAVYARPAETNLNDGDTVYVGNRNGRQLEQAEDDEDFSRIGAKFVEFDAPAYLMTYYERLFLEAEAAARGWITSDAQALYEAAVTASFEHHGLEVGDYLAADGPAAYDGLTSIALQKYIALYSRGTEAYCEWRRTGVPTLEVADRANIPSIPLRLPYPQSEEGANAQNVPIVSLTDPVDWDN